MINLSNNFYLWRSPTLRLWSIGTTDRIVEVSNYPRAEKDTTPKIYAKDTPFTVTKKHLNGKGEFVDSKGLVKKEGKRGMFYKGDPMIGSFPLWIEKDLPFTPSENYEFNFEGMPFPQGSLEVVEMEINKGRGWEKIDYSLTLIKTPYGWYRGWLVIPKDGEEKALLRIQYKI